MTQPVITRRHLARLRQIHRSSGWLCKDMLEVDLLVAGLVGIPQLLLVRRELFVDPIGLSWWNLFDKLRMNDIESQE
jgi:hypothetical protein